MRPGAKASVRVADRWGIGGVEPELCIGPVGGEPRCKTLAFPRAVTLASRRFQATERGRWRVELRVAGKRIRTAVVVGARAAPSPKPLPIVFAAGDSTMQGIDSFLADELAGLAYVRSDVRPGTGISRGVYWQWHAKSQTKRLRQRVTVMSVGAASDGLPIPNGDRRAAAVLRRAWIGSTQTACATSCRRSCAGVAGASCGSRRPSRAGGRARRSRTPSTSRSSAPRRA